MPSQKKSRTQSRSKTDSSTKTLALSAVGLVIASAFALMSLKVNQPFFPGLLMPSYGTPGYGNPGYGNPGYGNPGYGNPGYGTPGYQTSPQSACSVSGWWVDPVIHPLANFTSKSVLIKGSGPAVYWWGKDGLRHVFPNVATYRTWYPMGSACPPIYTIPDSDFFKINIGTNVTYRPGVKLVRIETDPKVYAVGAAQFNLHWIQNNAAGSALYGANWYQSAEVITDNFFVNYSIGNTITKASDFNPAAETAKAPNPDYVIYN